MTDATHAVTRSALEAFAREYLAELGASVREDGNRWRVALPAHVDVAFGDDREFDVVLSDEADADESARVLVPESEFTQRLLEAAAEFGPLGRVAITEDVLGEPYRYPAWVAESRATVEDASFTPYYDRTAVCAFVTVGVETVSEYQTQLLKAVAVDVESGTRLPRIAAALVERFYAPKTAPPETAVEGEADGGARTPPDELATAVAAAQEAAVTDADEEIAEIRRSASRAADAEFEEYRQLQEQRIDELRDEIATLSDRLRDVATDVDGAASQQRRVEVLRKRKELQDEKERSEARLEALLGERETGYAAERDDIYGRHAIEVTTTPVALTLVRYERGEIEMELRAAGDTDAVRAPYALGGGVTDDVRCSRCREKLSGSNPVVLTADGLGCHGCR